MQWPSSQDYNEAIQIPSDCFADADLAGGQALTNALGLPVPRSGNFADVYEFIGAGGAHLAIKCFTREVPGLHERYSAVSEHLVRADLPFSVHFTYLHQGIRIRKTWYPILKMDWVDGFLLNEFVRDNLDKPDRLDALAQIWVRTAQWLHSAAIVHGDLQHGNVILVHSRARYLALKLIDYDGMCVPALSDRASGEVGHPSYQHPQRLREGTYGPEVDRFSQLAVYTALRALAARGKPLWDEFDCGDNLLFRQSDFEAPGKSALFAQLLKIPQARSFATALIDAARVPLVYTPFLTQLVPEAIQSLPRVNIQTPVPAGYDAGRPAQKRPDWVADVAAAATAQPPKRETDRNPNTPDDLQSGDSAAIAGVFTTNKRSFTGVAIFLSLFSLAVGTIAGIVARDAFAFIVAGLSWPFCLVLGFLAGRLLESREQCSGAVKGVIRDGAVETEQPINLPDGTKVSIRVPKPTEIGSSPVRSGSQQVTAPRRWPGCSARA